MKRVQQQQISRCMITQISHGRRLIGSLSSARSNVAVAAVYNNAIVIFGGCTTPENVKSSSVIVVELGQVEWHMFH